MSKFEDIFQPHSIEVFEKRSKEILQRIKKKMKKFAGCLNNEENRSKIKDIIVEELDK